MAAVSFAWPGKQGEVKQSRTGSFFAIFGAGLITYSFAKPMKINIPATGPTAPSAAGTLKAGTNHRCSGRL
jgi:hypothetical protein